MPLHLSGPVPGWAADLAGEVQTDMAALFGRRLGRLQEAGALILGQDGAGANRLDLDGRAVPGRAVVNLSGAGWAAPSEKGAVLLAQHVAHEIAHLYQLQLYDGPLEPRVLHEGFAEALALEGLADTGRWDAAAVAAWRASAVARCGRAMENGPLYPQWIGGDADASYGCGFVVIEIVAEAAGLRPTGLYAAYAARMRDGRSLRTWAADTLPAGLRQSLTAFAVENYSAADPADVIAQLRAGRL